MFFLKGLMVLRRPDVEKEAREGEELVISREDEEAIRSMVLNTPFEDMVDNEAYSPALRAYAAEKIAELKKK